VITISCTRGPRCDDSQAPFLASDHSCSSLYGRKNEKGGTSPYHKSYCDPTRLTSRISHESHISYLLPPLSFLTPRGILPSNSTIDTDVLYSGIVQHDPMYPHNMRHQRDVLLSRPVRTSCQIRLILQFTWRSLRISLTFKTSNQSLDLGAQVSPRHW